MKCFPELMKDLLILNKGSVVTALFDIQLSPDEFNA